MLNLRLISLKGPKLLSYDLQILYDCVKAHDSQKVIIAFQDSEAFDGALLGDLITLFKYDSPRHHSRIFVS